MITFWEIQVYHRVYGRYFWLVTHLQIFRHTKASVLQNIRQWRWEAREGERKRTLWEGEKEYERERSRTWECVPFTAFSPFVSTSLSCVLCSLHYFRLLSRWWISGGYYCGLHDGRQLFKTIYSVCIVSCRCSQNRPLCGDTLWLSFRAIKTRLL